MAKKNTYTVFDNMDFPDYQYREFPKWVTAPDGQGLVVNNRDEEAEVLAGDTASAGTGKVQQAETPDEREQLLARAKDLGLDVKPQWGTARLRAAVEG